MSSIVAVPPRKSKSKKRRPGVLSLLKSMTSGIDVGQEVPVDGTLKPIHLNKNVDVLDWFQRKRSGNQCWLEHGLNWLKLRYHFYREQTYYFSGAQETWKPRTLFLIDVDCKTRGTPEGARAYLDYLSSHECRDKYGLSFPGLYKEVSTHGRGGHGFPILDKEGWSAGDCNDALLHRLEQWLNHVGTCEGFDIEFVEVKGTMPVIEYGREKGEVVAYKAGCLAKLPREVEDRLDEFLGTAVVTMADLLQLPRVDQRRRPGRIAENKRPVSETPGDRAVEDVNTRDGEEKEHPLVAQATKERPSPRNSGRGPARSTSGKYISEDELAGLQEGGKYLDLAVRLMNAHQLPTKGRHVARPIDLAIFLMCAAFFYQKPNKDGTLPRDRFGGNKDKPGLWDCLYQCRNVNRAFCKKRFQVIRDYLTSLGLIEWQDSTYVVGKMVNGVKEEGRACKWGLTSELVEQLGTATGAVMGVNDVDKGREERKEHPLVAQATETANAWVNTLVCLPSDETITPVETIRLSRFYLRPDEITDLIRGDLDLWATAA
ncbi:MAG TPA: hypothetical protein VHC22_32385 [Pirellulales bacterium]|nr:hypothetical protein [Pirellulales bacterium]